MMISESNKDMPLISVIMPAHNMEKYIGQAIESVLNQTYTNLELVICDDASTDRTCEIVESYTDPRIVLCHEASNTGSCYLPRQHAFQNSRGELVTALDADDYLDERYVEKMYARLTECSADVCICNVITVDENGAEVGYTSPEKGFDYSLQLSGRDAFYKLVTEWSFGTNDVMAKREAWHCGFQHTYKTEKYEFGEDENVGHILLLRANKVVFCEAIRYYRQRSGSIMHTLDRRIFGWRTKAETLLSVIGEEFGGNSREYKAAEHYEYVSYRELMIRFIGSINMVPKEEQRWCRNEFKKWHDRLDWKTVREYVGYPRYLLHRNFYVEYLASWLYFRKSA